MTFQLRKATEKDIPFINQLCELSWNNENQWLAYPRVGGYHELIAEIHQYNNTLENSILIINQHDEAIGFTGFLYENGDDEAFIIGPVFKEVFHQKERMSTLLKQVTTNGKENFKELILSTSSTNLVTNESLRSLGWELKFEQTEMKYEIKKDEHFTIQHPVKTLDLNHSTQIKVIAQLFEEIFSWENAEKRLRHYLEMFNMRAAYIEDDGRLLGAVLWDHIDETNFYRLEDVAVNQNNRGKGVGTSLIHFVLNDAKKTDIQDVFLSVDESNQTAQRLYQSIGFKKTIQSNTYIHS